MNREALRHWFEEEMEVEYEEFEEHFVINTGELSDRDLREIGACRAGLADHDSYGRFKVVDKQ